VAQARAAAQLQRRQQPRVAGLQQLRLISSGVCGRRGPPSSGYQHAACSVQLEHNATSTQGMRRTPRRRGQAIRRSAACAAPRDHTLAAAHLVDENALTGLYPTELGCNVFLELEQLLCSSSQWAAADRASEGRRWRRGPTLVAGSIGAEQHEHEQQGPQRTQKIRRAPTNH
jgi:hypothetical protein